MKEFKNEELGVRFTIPARPTVRQQLAYWDAAAREEGVTVFETRWRGVLALLQEWQCEAMPDAKADLDSLDSPTVTRVISWAGTQVFIYVGSLEDVPKN